MTQGQGETEFQSAGILKYVEKLKRGFNTEIGTKSFFEIASIYSGVDLAEGGIEAFLGNTGILKEVLQKYKNGS